MTVPDLTLYYEPGSVSLFIRIVLVQGEFENVKFVKLIPTESKGRVTEDGRDYTDINPKGWIPALIIDDSELLTESVAIAQYLVSLKPEKFYWPTKDGLEKYKAVAMLNFITSDIHKTFMIPSKPFSNQNIRDWVAQDISKRYQYFEDILSKQKFLLGDQFSIADAYAYNTTRWLDHCDLDITKFPKIVEWRKAIEQLPYVQKAIKEEGVEFLA